MEEGGLGWGKPALHILLPDGVANGLVGLGGFKGGEDFFGEGGVGGGDVFEAVEGLGGFFVFTEVGLGVGEGEEVVAVLVFGKLAEAGGQGEGFFGAPNFIIGCVERMRESRLAASRKRGLVCRLFLQVSMALAAWLLARWVWASLRRRVGWFGAIAMAFWR